MRTVIPIALNRVYWTLLSTRSLKQRQK